MWIVSYCFSSKRCIDFADCEITPDWFTLDKEVETVDFYVFTLDPADDEVLVNVNAVIGEAKTPADALTGMTLKVDGIVVDVKENGTYRIAK